MADLMQDLVKHTLETRYEDLPPEAIDYAKNSILDITGIIIAGSSGEGVKEVADLVKDWGGREEATIPIYGGKVPAVGAAFAIGPMTRARDLGDIFEGAPIRGHPTETIFPAALPAAELRGGITGKEFITAMAVGQDVIGRIGAGGVRDDHWRVTAQPGETVKRILFRRLRSAWWWP